MTRIRSNFYLIVTIIFIALSSVSCNKATGSIFSKIFKRVAESGVESASEKTIRIYGIEALKELPWDDIIVIIEKENPLVGASIKKLSRTFQEHIAGNINLDPRLFYALLSSETLWDDYRLFVGNSSKLVDNADIFTWYALARYAAPDQNGASIFERAVIRNDDGVIKILDKSSGDAIAEIKGSIINVFELSNGKYSFPDNSILKSELLHDAVYKARGENGLEYLFNVDKIGRVSSVTARYISPEDITNNILGRNSDIVLGSDGIVVFKQIKEASKGQDISLLVTYKYTGESRTPSYINFEGDVSGHNSFNFTFQNIDAAAGKIHSTADNRALVRRVADKLGIDAKKQEKLLSEMSENEALEELIYLDPETNIQRWLNTRNHVDQHKIARQSNGQFVLNGRVYAGNTFYFNPALNDGVSAKIKSNGKYDYYTLEQLLELDKKYPNGVPYNEKGFPDFIKAGACKKQDGELLIFNFPGGKFTGDDAQDINIATQYMKEKYGDSFDMSGFTWHHLEDPPARLVLVDYDVHRICKHTGGNSLLN